MLQGWQPEPPEVKHLNTLSICQFFYAFGAVLCGSLMAYYPTFLRWAIANSPRSSNSLTPDMVTYMTTVFAFYAAVIYAVAILSVVAGVMIRRRKGWLFIAILSGFDLLFVPFGTALGIGCLITITKPHVKAMFEGATPGAPPRLL